MFVCAEHFSVAGHVNMLIYVEYVCLCSSAYWHANSHCQLGLGAETCSSFASAGPLDSAAYDNDLFTWPSSWV